MKYHRKLLQAPNVVWQAREAVAIQYKNRKRCYRKELRRQSLNIVELQK
jgi:hypothetical protein